jgi:hypothetical protein
MVSDDLIPKLGHRVSLPVQRMPVFLLVILKEVRRPLAEQRAIPEGCCDPKLNDVARFST